MIARKIIIKSRFTVPGEASAGGFSLVELIMSLALSLLILGVAVATFSGALGSRDRESSRTDALTSAQAALNVMSREIGNAGYGLVDNGIVAADSNGKRLHIRANVENTGNDGLSIDQPGEDITFFWDSESQSVVRYDRITGTSGVINRISDVDFIYHNYTYNPATGVTTVTPGPAGPDTGRVEIILEVSLPDVHRQAVSRTETVSSDVTLRNSVFMRGQY